MKSIAIVAPVEVQTVDGRKVPTSRTENLTFSQLELYLAMAGEPTFLGERRGLPAARFQDRARREISKAFAEHGDGILSDDVADALLKTAAVMVFSFKVNGVEIGPATIWSFLPLLEPLERTLDGATENTARPLPAATTDAEK